MEMHIAPFCQSMAQEFCWFVYLLRDVKKCLAAFTAIFASVYGNMVTKHGSKLCMFGQANQNYTGKPVLDTACINPLLHGYSF